MKKTLISLFVTTAIGITAAGLLASENEGEHEEYERAHHGERDHDDNQNGVRRGGTDYLSDPQYALYKTECADCHMAYPPTPLPASSWQGTMGSLEDHFGDNAELDAATAGQVGSFLARKAAGSGRGEYAESDWPDRKKKAPVRRKGDRGLL